ncbi:MAG: M81 family metallopeptidase [Pseudomonadota bacterium]
MKVFIACLGTETNSFAAMPTGWTNFEETMLYRGDATAHPPSTFSLPLHVWRKAAEERQGEVVESVAAFAQPAGTTVRKVYESLRDEILADLRAALPVDMVLLSMHGAMTADGYEDCEGDLLSSVRQVAGPSAVIGGELDLHCSITPEMVEAADVLVTFKEYPHIDVAERAAEVFALCHAAHEGNTKPVMAVYDTRMINMWRTPVEPMKQFVADMQSAEGRDTVLSVSFAHGFPWQDVPHTSAKMLVIADGDPTLAAETAKGFADRLWDMREATQGSTLSMDEALDAAIEGPGPVVMADVADNAGGGAPSDSTFILRRALERGDRGLLIGYFWDPVAARFCGEAGEGETLDLRVGGKCGPSSGDPVDLRVTVKRILHNASQTFGDAQMTMGTAVWLTTEDGIDLILTTKRTQVFHPDGMEQLGISPQDYRGLVVKSIQHFYAGFAPIASKVLYVSAPGAIPRDYATIPYRRFTDSYWPKDETPTRP